MCMSHESWPRKALHKLRRSNRHTWNSFTWPPEGCKVLLLASVGHVCLFARISQKPRVQTSLIFEQVTYGHGSVFLWRQWVASCFHMGLIHKTRHGRVLQVTYREVARGQSLILRLPWYGNGVLQWVCLCVCLPESISRSGTTRPIFSKFLCMLPVAVVSSSSIGVAIRCVLPVSWVRSYLHILAGNRRSGKGIYSNWLNRGHHKPAATIALFSKRFPRTKIQAQGLNKKVKFSHTRYRALGPELIPVYRQSARRWREVNHAI